MTFAETIRKAPVTLTDGATIERLRRDQALELDPHVLHAGFVFQPAGRNALETIYRQYLDIGRQFALPMIVLTPTWRANPERVRLAGLGDHGEVNAQGFRFLAGVREDYGPYSEQILIGGLLGPRGDAYRPTEALPEDEAAGFHGPQAAALSEAGTDFLMAATLPAASEAVGVARAMARCAVPYLISFVVRSTGALLDGTPLAHAIERIDADTESPPLGYMVNCVHPSVFAVAMDRTIDQSPKIAARVMGLQANTSRLSPEELDDLDHLDEADDSETLADAMVELHRRLGIKILGGCCGTDNRHICCIAKKVSG